MKKLLLFCLLSVFMSMTYVSNAQSPGSGCCFWLENIQPDTPADIYSLNPMATSQGEDQYYYFKFDNNGCLDPNSKVSIDWQITRNGQPLDAITLGQLEIEIQTKNPLLNLINNNGFVSSGQLRSGQGFGSALGCTYKTDYPGGLGGAHSNTYCPNTQEFTYYNLSPNNLYNYFYVHFLQYASDNNLIRLKIKRQDWSNVDFKINVQLIERTGGEAYENPYRPAQGTTHYYIGGKLAQRGDTLSNFLLEEQTYLTDSESACSGVAIEVGRDPQGQPYSYVMSPILPELSAQMVVDVPFYNTNWTCVDYIDSMVTYTLTWASAPAEPSVVDQTRCGAGKITFTGSHDLEPGINNLIYRWYGSSDLSNLLHEGNTFTTPALAEDQEISYWVTASIVTGCEGLPLEVTAKAFKQPIITLTNPTDLCPDAGNKTVMAVVTNVYPTTPPPAPDAIPNSPAIPAQFNYDLTVNWTGATQNLINDNTIYAYVPVTNACNATYTYSVTITDDVSGCTATASTSFTLVDTEAPTFTAPQAAVVEKDGDCMFDITPDNTGEPQNIVDNCSDDNYVITYEDFRTDGTCLDNYTIRRTWRVADHCGNATTANQEITVVDIIAPLIVANNNTYVAVPSPNCTFVVTNALLEQIAEDFNATDNCSNVTVTYSVTAGTAISQPTTVILTFADACGNETEESVVVVLPEPIVNSYTVTPSSADGCYGTEFTFDVTVTNGVTPYVIEWDNSTLVGFNPSITPTLTNINTDQDFTYSYTVSDVNGCTTSDQITVTVYGAPAFELTPSHEICFGEETDLTVTYGSGVTSVLWSTTETTDQITVKPATTTTYTVLLTNNHGCTAEKSVTVTVNPLPVFEVSKISDDSYCVGDNGAISILPNDGTYIYFNGANQITLPFDGLAVGTYTITAVNPTTECSATAQPIEILDAIVLPEATLNISDITDHCFYGNIQVDILATSDQANASFYITVNGVEIPDVNGVANYTFTQAGVYTFEVVTTNPITGCVSSVVSEVITINPLPVNPLLSVNDSEICIGEEVTLTATPQMTGYTYTFGTNVPSVINTLEVTPANIGVNTYSVIITTEHGCTATATVNVTVNPLPVITSITANNNCPNTITNVTALVTAGTPDYSYTWSGDVTGTTNPIQLTDLTCGAVNDISLQVTDSKGCIATSSTTITLVDETDPTIAFENPVDNDIQATCTTIPAASSFTLVVADNCTPTAQLDVDGPVELIVNQTCTYRYDIQRTWTVTDFCGNSSSITQTIHINDVTPPTFEVPANIAICKNNANLYDADPEVTGDVEVLSDNCTPEANLVVDYTDVPNVGTATEVGTILRTWTVTDVCGNVASTTQTITLNPAPVATLVVDPTSFCLPDAGLEVSATLTGTPGTATYNYSITLPGNTTVTTSTESILITTPGIHTFTGFVTNSTTLCASAVVEVNTNAMLYPDFDITVIQNKRGCRDDVPSLNGSFSVTHAGDYTFSISPNVGSYAAGVFSNLPIGVYNVTATHPTNGCSFTQQQAIVFDPAFTPVALFELGGRDADTAVCWTSGLYLSTLVTDLNNVFAHTYNYHIIVPVNVTALGSNGVRIEQPGVYAIGAVVENVTTGCRDTAWHYVYAMAYPTVDVTSEPFCYNTEVDLTMTALPVLVAPHSYTYAWTSVNTGTDILGTATTLSHPTTISNKYYGAATAHYAYSGLNVYGQTLTFNLACTSRDSVTVTPLPLPEFTAQQSAAKRVCNANTPGAITIGDGWNAAFTWTLTRVATGTTSTITTPTFNVPDSGYYHITAVDLNGCTYTLSNVFVGQEYVGFNAILHADILPLVAPEDKSANLTLCWDNQDERLYHEIRYTNNPIFSYQYTIITPTNIDQVSSTYSLIRASGTYLMSGYVTNLTTGCVSNIDTLMVYAVPTPVYAITPATTICRGESIKVGITPISTFTTVWTAGPTTNDSLMITPAMYGTGSTFTANVGITATLPGAGFGCTANDAVVITINDQPVLGHIQNNVLCNGGATGAIDLSVSGASPFTYIWSNGANTEDMAGLFAGTYNVTVTDKFGCTSTRSIVITQPTVLVATMGTTTHVSCNGLSNGSATVGVTGGTTAYSYLWNNGQTTATLTNVVAGNYTVTVTDGNLCTTVSNVTITQPEILNTTGIVTDNVCNGGNIGAIDLTVNGGTSPFSYIWSNSAITQDISGLTAGTYGVTVTDANGCTATASYTVNQPDELDATVASTNVLCNGANNGTITITLPTGGSGSYEYRLNTGTWQSSGSFTGLPNATYSVQIRDANATSCVIVLGTEIITQPTLLTASITDQTNVACFGLSTGSATVTPVGGTLSYSYSWGTAPVQTGATATGLAAGTYVVTVTDGYLCTATTTAIITQPLDITLNTPTYQPIACNGGSTTVNMTATGGTGTLTYTFNGVPNTTGVFSTIVAGTYNYSVTDANECGPKTGSITIGQPTAVTATISDQENLDCYAVSTGTATVTAGGGTPDYTYLWSNTQTSAQATGLAAATYTVTVRDANNCSASTSVTLTQPDAIVLTSATVTSTIPCNGGTGTVTIIATGGTGTISYTFNGETNTTGIFTGVFAGTRPYSITDNNGCGPITGNVEISEPALLTVSFTGVTSNTCNGATIGTATASPSGGTTAYNYAWSTGATTPGISSLGAATYSVTITDARGCTTSNSIEITEPAILNASVASTNVSCNGGSNGTITVSSPTGGTTSNYEFRLNTGSWQSGLTFTGLTAGTYSVQIRHAVVTSCVIVLGDQVITEPTVVTATITAQLDPTCNGGSNGTATVTAGGGTAPYTYAWSNSQSNAGATGLSAATYTVTVTDANSCTASTSVTLTQPTAVTGSASVTTAIACNGGTGTVTLVGGGGTGAISYTFNGVTNGTGTFTGILAGVNYPYSITDANNCGPVTGTLTVSQPTQVTASITAQTNVACFGNSTGSATVTPNGGTPGYTYEWGTTPTQTGPTATGLIAGTYVVTVTDANLCTATTSVTITQPAAPLAASITSSTDILCFGTSTGAIDLTVTGGTTNYSYAWTGGAITQDISGLAAGTYTVTVTDAALCTTTASVTLSQPAAAVTATTTPTHVKCFGGNDGSAQANPVGGVGPYTYSWNTSPVQTGQTATGLIAGTYIVTVTDANNCTTTASAVITQPTVLSGSIIATSPICTGTTTTVNLTVTGGTGTITYLWSSSETTEDITKSAGTYTVTITDGNNCTTTASTTITNQLTPTITTNEPPQVCLGVSFTVTAASTQTGTWSAQAYHATTDVAIGVPVLSAAYTYSSATPDTIYIVYTFSSSVGPCTYYHETNDIIISANATLLIYDSNGDNIQTVNQGQSTEFYFEVQACQTAIDTRLALNYSIYYQDSASATKVLISNLTNYVSNNSITYKMNFDGTVLLGSYPTGYTYSTSLPNSHFPLAPSTVINNYQFDFFRLYYMNDRRFDVGINNFIKPGIYTFEYELVTNYEDIAQTIPKGFLVGVNVDPGQRLGGNQFFSGTYYPKVWASNTMTITVNPVPTPAPPTPIEPTPIQVSEVTPELAVYPNPTTPEQSVNVELSHFLGDAILTVTTVNGKVIERVPITVTEGQKSVIHTISNSVPGMYFVTITTKETILTKKLIVQPK